MLPWAVVDTSWCQALMGLACDTTPTASAASVDGALDVLRVGRSAVLTAS